MVVPIPSSSGSARRCPGGGGSGGSSCGSNCEYNNIYSIH